jgi:hypothetical protein
MGGEIFLSSLNFFFVSYYIKIPCLMIEILLVDGVNLLVLHVLLLEVRVGKVQERTRAQHAAYRTLVQLARLQAKQKISGCDSPYCC